MLAGADQADDHMSPEALEPRPFQSRMVSTTSLPPWARAGDIAGKGSVQLPQARTHGVRPSGRL